MIKWLLVIAVGVTVISFASPWLARHGLGHLPGDITISGANFTCFIPLATSIILSIVLTILLNVALRIFNR